MGSIIKRSLPPSYICDQIYGKVTTKIILRGENFTNALSGVEISPSILKTGAAGTWKQLFKGFYKLNCDGSLKTHPQLKISGMAACGSVIRDRLGNIKIASVQNLGIIGHVNLIAAEGPAIEMGMKDAAAIGIENLMIETDSQAIFYGIIEGFKHQHNVMYTHMVQRIRSMLLSHPKWKLYLIPRTANNLADQFAKMGYKAEPGEAKVFHDVEKITNTDDQKTVMRIVEEDKTTMGHW